MKIKTMDRVLGANDAWAVENRAFLARQGAHMLNIIGSPGAGKTTLLERTIDMLKKKYRIGVIEGDIATRKDAQRIQKKGVPVYQINTGNACHLDANLVNSALKELCKKRKFDCIFVENIGNLVCPAEFDIGEHGKVAVLSVAEGDDKVEKYPLLFSEAKMVVISKTGLLAHTNFNIARTRAAIKRLNKKALVSEVDSLSGSGFGAWTDYIERNLS